MHYVDKNKKQKQKTKTLVDTPKAIKDSITLKIEMESHSIKVFIIVVTRKLVSDENRFESSVSRVFVLF